MKNKMITAERARELLNYDADTGLFTRRVQTSNRIKVGDIAGTCRKDGYVRIVVDGSRQQASRLAWLYVHGTDPVGQIDHINGNRSDNRIANLRDESEVVNQHNQRRAHRNSSTGFLGVSIRGRGRFAAQIKAGQNFYWLGLFETAEAAYAAYVEAKRKLHRGCTL